MSDFISDEFDESAVLWAGEHQDDLIGKSADDASAAVRAAGFRPMVLVLNGNAFALTGGTRRVRLYAFDGRVVRAEGN